MNCSIWIDQQVRYSLIDARLPAPPARILEVGVGGGGLFLHLAGRGFEVTGCDVDVNALPPDFPLRHKVIQASGAALPFADRTFDATYSCDVLEHVPPQLRDPFLREMLRVTKPGGRVVVSAFYHTTFTARLWGAAHLMARGRLPTWYSEHISIPPPDYSRTREVLAEGLDSLEDKWYQGPLSLGAFLIQALTPEKLRPFRAAVGKIGGLVTACDILGARTSCVMSGNRK